jgi:hypothetical protein
VVERIQRLVEFLDLAVEDHRTVERYQRAADIALAEVAVYRQASRLERLRNCIGALVGIVGQRGDAGELLALDVLFVDRNETSCPRSAMFRRAADRTGRERTAWYAAEAGD